MVNDAGPTAAEYMVRASFIEYNRKGFVDVVVRSDELHSKR
jgi:hypothetical protein